METYRPRGCSYFRAGVSIVVKRDMVQNRVSQKKETGTERRVGKRKKKRHEEGELERV